MSDDNTTYSVVINHEEQYSIWPSDREIPQGWKSVADNKSKDDALNFIEEAWTDMTPASMREQLQKTHG